LLFALAAVPGLGGGMNTGKTVFTQLMERIHPEQFKRFVERHGGNYKVRHCTCWEQFLCLAFGQLTFRDSLREVVTCLNARPELLYHLGLRGPVCRSTLADANERRDWRVYADLGAWLLARARRLYAGEPLAADWAGAAYALDATTIDLCLGLFPWADFRSAKAGVKLLTQLDLRGTIPSGVIITPARWHEIVLLDWLTLEPGALYLFDRGFLDFGRLHRLAQTPAFFIIPAKRRLDLRRCRSRPHPEPGVRSDQIVRLGGFYARRAYPDQLRLVHYFDAGTARHLWFLTNHFRLSALAVAQLYQRRWQVELFFKWIKQHLCIKVFYGTSENALKTQIWVVLCVYALLAIVKKELQLPQSLHEISQVLSVSVLEKVPLDQLLMETAPRSFPNSDRNQLIFNNL
jgi:hypothetical protein